MKEGSLEVFYELRVRYGSEGLTDQASKKIYIFRPLPPVNKDAFRFTVNSTVASTMGGLFGFKPSICITNVEINQNCFHPGEVIRINIDCDNTNSSNAVKSFKFKLHRKCAGIVNTDQG